MIEIRAETTHDHDAIWNATKRAFEGKAFSDGDEPDLIDTLRSQGDLVLSLVAVDDDLIVGQISFSKATITSQVGTWFALGPISVIPERQAEGIGGLLIESGMKKLEETGASGCILTGDPRYYSRHGFKLAPDHCPDNESVKHFQIRMITDNKPSGQFAFHSAFYTNT